MRAMSPEYTFIARLSLLEHTPRQPARQVHSQPARQEAGQRDIRQPATQPASQPARQTHIHKYKDGRHTYMIECRQASMHAYIPTYIHTYTHTCANTRI